MEDSGELLKRVRVLQRQASALTHALNKLHDLLDPATSGATLVSLETLTDREQEVARWALSGDSMRRTATRLGLSPRTIEVHRQRAFKKLNVLGVEELISKYRK